jgi:hypothetical protein
MFSHESIPLTAIFIIMLLCLIAAFLHPVHAFFSWIRRRKNTTSTRIVDDSSLR